MEIGEKSPQRPFLHLRSKFQCLQPIYRWKGHFISINIAFKSRVQKSTYFELLIENQTDIFLKVVGFLLKIDKIQKNDLTKLQQLFN